MDPYGRAGQVLMTAAHVSGIPHAFVVDGQGTVQHHGHPADPSFEAAVRKAGPGPPCLHPHAFLCTACLWQVGQVAISALHGLAP